MYGKVFESIYDGTLYGHWEAIVTMQQLIVLSDQNGIVDMTVPAICARTSIPREIIEKGIEVLQKPDPYTRTPGEEGRRIILLDEHRPWGWRLVNHGKYRALRNMEQKKEADRKRIAEKRKQINGVAIESQSVADVAHADADADTEADTDTKNTARPSGLRTGKKDRPVKGAWWETEDATRAKAASLGLSTRAGESWADFRARIRSAIEALAR